MIERLRRHLLALVGDRHPVTSPAGLRLAEDYLRREFAQLGLKVTTHSFMAFSETYHNLVATLSPVKGPTSPLPPLIVAAHYDTVAHSPGADDNASGLAVLLEAARILRQQELHRAVRFIAFSLEEADLLGSLAYAAALRERHEQIAGAIVLECVGYASLLEGSQRRPAGLPVVVPSVGDFLGIIGNETSRDLVAMLEQAARQFVPELKVLPLLVPGQGELFPDTRRSDHAAFWAHGYPAVMLTDTAEFRNPHYHQPTDTVETLDLTFMARVVRLLAEAGRAPAVSESACWQ